MQHYIYFSLSKDPSFSSIINKDSTTTDTTKNITGLARNQKYYWRVQAQNEAGVSQWSDIWNFTGIGTSILAFNKSSIILPSVKIGQWKDTTVSVSNTGTDTLKITNITSSKTYFSIRPIVLTIAPSESKLDTIRFIPDSVGTRNGLILFVSNDQKGADTVVVSGNGTTTGIDKAENGLPKVFALDQNYPNPFNPATTITFSVGTHSYTSLRVFDALGREVATLISQEKSAGIYQVTFDASKLPSGVYFYRLTAGDFTQVKKMLLVK